MALDWDEMIGRNFGSGSNKKRSWDDLMGTYQTSSGQSTNRSRSYGDTIPSGYEGTEYEGLTNDEIVQRVAEKQKTYDEEIRQRRQAIVEKQQEVQQRQREQEEKRAARTRVEDAVNKGKNLVATIKTANETANKTANETTNKTEEPESKGWFLDLAKGIKDTLVSIPVSVFEAGKRNRYDFSGSRQRKERSN